MSEENPNPSNKAATTNEVGRDKEISSNEVEGGDHAPIVDETVEEDTHCGNPPQEESDSDVKLADSSDDEEDSSDEEPEAAAKPKVAKHTPNKKVAKSTVVFYVKPMEVSTDEEESLKAQELLLQKVKSIKKDGLIWEETDHKPVYIFQYVWKLQIGCVIEDAKVSVDELQEDIENLDNGELVQSVDTESFQKV